MRAKSLMSLKVLSNLGLPKKISKSPYVGRFSVNHAKSNFSIRIPLYANLGFHKKMLFSQICSNGHMRAKRAARASELRQRVSLAQSSQIKQTKQSFESE